MTDKEIIKALECCMADECKNYTCNECPYKICGCSYALCKDALDLIKRQQAEIEKLISGATVKAVGGIAELIEKQQAEIKRLHSEVEEKTETIVFLKDQAVGWSIDFCNLKAKLDAAKSEAIKEFAERLKMNFFKFGFSRQMTPSKHIDNLVKEMTEELK